MITVQRAYNRRSALIDFGSRRATQRDYLQGAVWSACGLGDALNTLCAPNLISHNARLY
jgi:hypothetical protein